MVTAMSWNIIKRPHLCPILKSVWLPTFFYFYMCYNLKKKEKFLNFHKQILFFKSADKKNYTYNRDLSNLAKCVKCEYALSNHFQTHTKLNRFLSGNHVYMRNWFLTIMSHLELKLIHTTIWKSVSPCLQKI